ncbi:MAG: hypothetical protein N3E47_06585 [Candidatus Bathyarchaeota archaeon]|nr:hypothetical protein [Candidatus Bathyarchaeota archaeon]
MRAKEERIGLDEDALEKLTEIGASSSLRYSVQLLSLAAQNARYMKRDTVTLNDVERVRLLFMDVNQAVEHLKKYEMKMLYY